MNIAIKKQCNQIEENIDFDKLYALSLSLNQTQYATAILAKKSINCQNQSMTLRKEKINTKKGIMNLKQKLLDKKFLDNLSQQEYFNLYYRYVTFRKNIYDAKLSDKITVSDFFIKYWKVHCQKYHNFQTIFEDFINEEQLKEYQTQKTVVYSEDDFTKIIQTESDGQKRKNYKTKVCKILSDKSPLYSVIICFRFMIANCIYIDPSNFQKRELFITLICEYFLIDGRIFSYENDFNFLIPWCKIIIKQHSFFTSQEQAIQYLCKNKKNQDVNLILKEAKMNQNFLELLERLWRMNQSSRILNHRLKPIIIKYPDASYYKQHIDFILKDRKTLRNHFSSQVAIQKFIKIIEIQKFVQQGAPFKDFKQFFLLEEDLKIIKNEILKNKNLTGMAKVNMLKLISLKLFVYDTFIQETAKISQTIAKQKEIFRINNLLQNNDAQNAFKDEIHLLRSSQSYFQENYLISNAKKTMLELTNTPLSYTGIEDFHFHLIQRLRMQGKFLECQSIIRLIDRTINCKEVSNDFLNSERRYIYYYIEKNELGATESFQRSVNQFNEYEMICNIGWIEELITFTSIALSQQPTRIKENLSKFISKKQRDEYILKNQQYAAYIKLLQVQEIFVSKLKKYIKTSVLSLDSNRNFVSRKDYNNFFRIIRQSLNFLKTSPPKQFLSNLSSEYILKDSESKKDFFYDVFEKALPFCAKNLNKITKNPLMRRFIYCINDEERDFEKEFRLMKLQTRAMRYFEQRKYMKTITIVNENLEQLGIRSHLTDSVTSKMQCIKCMMIYVKAFFIQYRLKNFCWYEKYNSPGSVGVKIGNNRQELIQFISKQSSLLDESEKKYEVTYQEILRILYLYFVTTGQFLASMRFNAPTLQFLVEIGKNVDDEKSYFQICLYLVSISRYLSKSSHFSWTSYVMGNIEEFANKNLPAINKPLFEYLIKFTERIITHHDENFSSESKEWKNPIWWLFVNIFLRYTSISTPLVKKMLVKIASVLEYLNVKLRDQVSSLFYINYLRYKDMEAFKGSIPLDKLKIYLRRLHKFQAKRSFNQWKIQYYLRIRIKSFCGINPIFFHQIPRHYPQRSYISGKNSFEKENDQLTDKKQSENLYFFCIKFEGFEKGLNFFYKLNKDQLNPSLYKEKYQRKSQKQIKKNDKQGQTQQKIRQNLVRKPSFCRSDIQDKQNEKNDKNATWNSLGIIFSYEFNKKVIDVYFKYQKSNIHTQPEINSTKGRIFRTIAEKIYVQQKNIENIHFEIALEEILTKKKNKRQSFRKRFSNSGCHQFAESQQA